MRMKFFAIPALAPGEAEAELASFLASQRVLAIDRNFVAEGDASYWALCVTYQQPSAGSTPAAKSSKRARVDYRELLSEQDFALFARLRDLRKIFAQREAVPPYAIFTNEHLAILATQRPSSAKGLAAIPGIGPARVEKYGERVLELLRQAPAAQPTTDGEPPA